jgi:glycosyltransferase involved in cell wall biosynthesis
MIDLYGKSSIASIWGKPVILSIVNIASLFKDGSDALLLQVGNPKEIAQAYINVFQDKNIFKRLGTNAKIISPNTF